jgi:hypothetical protein
MIDSHICRLYSNLLPMEFKIKDLNAVMSKEHQSIFSFIILSFNRKNYFDFSYLTFCFIWANNSST